MARSWDLHKEAIEVGRVPEVHLAPLFGHANRNCKRSPGVASQITQPLFSHPTTCNARIWLDLFVYWLEFFSRRSALTFTFESELPDLHRTPWPPLDTDHDMIRVLPALQSADFVGLCTMVSNDIEKSECTKPDKSRRAMID